MKENKSIATEILTLQIKWKDVNLTEIMIDYGILKHSGNLTIQNKLYIHVK